LRLHAESRSLAVYSIRTIALAALTFALTLSGRAQSSAGNWAWMGGSSVAINCKAIPCPEQAGIYGVEYQFGATSLPGYRYGGATWTGADGRLWMFGGFGFDANGNSGDLSDLWAFDPRLGAHGKWAWMGGRKTAGPTGTGVYGTQYLSDTANLPGARSSSATWIDANGRLWLFGGVGIDSVGTTGLLNDLWVFDPASGAHGQWTWISGSKTLPPWTWSGASGISAAKGAFAATNTPGSRSVPVAWTDASGRMWLWSGSGYDSKGLWVDLEDWWVFDPAQGAHGEWAWMGGPKAGPLNFSDPSIHSAEFQFAPANMPGFRQAVSHWEDAKGNLWLFGGLGSDSAGTIAPLNEVWTYDATKAPYGEWAWAGGVTTITDMGARGNLPGQRGIFGPKYRFGDTYVPGARMYGDTWTDSKGRLWLLGGVGVARLGVHGLLNDLWAFDPAKGAHGQWAWMGGNDQLWCDSHGCYGRTSVYGTEYVFSPGNVPGGRGSGQSWTDAQGNLWMFCGTGYDSVGTNGNLRDLWEFRFF
jgi:N-acetylneuraminic acid mutarotase